LVRVRQAYAESAATKRRLERKKEQIESSASDWYQRAKLALAQGEKDYLAKEALSRRQILLDEVRSVQSQIESLSTDKLYEAMTALEAKIREAYGKKEQLVARAKTAKNTVAVNDMLSGLTGKTSMDAFIRMEEKVQAMEAAAEASAEFSLLGSSDRTTPSLEAEFLMLEQNSDVDYELSKLKRELHLIEGSEATFPKQQQGKVVMKEFERVYLN
jgi:phage shock protein A